MNKLYMSFCALLLSFACPSLFGKTVGIYNATNNAHDVAVEFLAYTKYNAHATRPPFKQVPANAFISFEYPECGSQKCDSLHFISTKWKYKKSPTDAEQTAVFALDITRSKDDIPSNINPFFVILPDPQMGVVIDRFIQ